jgi:hypothetical protein
MSDTRSRSLRLVVGLLLGSVGLMAVAVKTPLADAQLDTVFAAGFEIKDVQVQIDFDVMSSNPNATIFQGSSLAAVQEVLNQGLSLSHSLGTRNSGSFDPSGAYMPNLQNLTINNINIADGALKDATTLMNIFALDGDVAVGVNLNVIINPTNSYFAVMQNNVNWGALGLSDALGTMIDSN